MLDLLLIEWVTKMKPGNNSVEDHPQLSITGIQWMVHWSGLVHCGWKGHSGFLGCKGKMQMTLLLTLQENVIFLTPKAMMAHDTFKR
jgi:hypothetical protein